jgi:hypothetical protein
MPWAKFSDTSAHHPTVLAPMALVDWQPPRLTQTDLVNLLAGIFERCAVQSAGYLTDYVITAGVLASTAGDNWQHWAALMQRAGYLTPVELDNGDTAWRLIDDPTNLVHIRLKDDLEWERQRKRDNSNPTLTVGVRLRDGDACRYCGVLVVWGDNRGARGGTYDHRIAGQPATGPDDLRVACHACNGRRSSHADADDWCPPRPAPATPYYGAKTAAYLNEHGHKVRRSRQRPDTRSDTAPRTTSTLAPAQRPRTPRDTAASDPTPSRTTPPSTTTSTTGTAPRDPAASRTPPTATPPPTGPRDPAPTRDSTTTDTEPRDSAPGGTPREQPEHQDQHRSADPANRRSPEPGSPGRDGSGREPPPLHPPTPSIRSRRGRRGRRP